MKIYIATDHKGVDIENQIVESLKEKGIEVIQTKIPHSDTDDYPDFAFEVANNVVSDKGSYGILICGTGVGMSIAANKVKGIRASVCKDVETAKLTRIDNDSNILCLSYKTPLKEILDIIDAYLNTPHSKEERHHRRVNKIIKYEDGEYNEL